MRSGTVQTLQLTDVPPPRRDPDAGPILAPGASGEEATVPRGAKVITSETSIASTSVQVGAAQSTSTALYPGAVVVNPLSFFPA